MSVTDRLQTALARLADNRSLTSSISMSDYRVAPYDEGCFDLFCIARK